MVGTWHLLNQSHIHAFPVGSLPLNTHQISFSNFLNNFFDMGPLNLEQNEKEANSPALDSHSMLDTFE